MYYNAVNKSFQLLGINVVRGGVEQTVYLQPFGAGSSQWSERITTQMQNLADRKMIAIRNVDGDPPKFEAAAATAKETLVAAAEVTASAEGSTDTSAASVSEGSTSGDAAAPADASATTTTTTTSTKKR